jgi:transposase
VQSRDEPYKSFHAAGGACLASNQIKKSSMNTLAEFKATLGLDWADQKHDVWIHPSDGSKAERVRVEQTPEALHEWVARLRQRYGNGQIAVGIETSRGPIISALMAYDFIVLFPVNPKALKDYRAAFSVSGAKDDRTDAQLLEEFIRLHAHKLRPLRPDTELTRKLAGLVENRRHLVDERTRIINQLHAKLKTYYPLAETLLRGEMNSGMAAEFLIRWPDLQSVRAAGPKALRAFFYKHNSRSPRTLEKRLEAVKKAQPLTSDAALIEPARQLVVALAGILKTLHRSVAASDQAIQQAMEEHPDAPIFRSFPAAGAALAPRLLVAFGTQRDRFQSADEVAQFFGIAPVVIQSGNSKTTHMRHRCPKFGRQTFHENASCAAKLEPWARCYYERQRKRNQDKHHQACRALAYKLIRIYFACWKNRQPYQSHTFLRALARNGSPLHPALTTSKSNFGE